MAYDNRGVGPLKVKGSPYKKNNDKIKGETKDAYMQRTLDKKEYLKWKMNLQYKAPLVWDGSKWISKKKWDDLAGNKKKGKDWSILRHPENTLKQKDSE